MNKPNWWLAAEHRDRLTRSFAGTGTGRVVLIWLVDRSSPSFLHESHLPRKMYFMRAECEHGIGDGLDEELQYEAIEEAEEYRRPTDKKLSYYHECRPISDEEWRNLAEYHEGEKTAWRELQSEISEYEYSNWTSFDFGGSSDGL